MKTEIKPLYYFYHRRLLKSFFGLIDAIGFSFFTIKPRIARSTGKILVINMGGAGDLIISEPLMSALSNLFGRPVDLVCFPDQEKALLELSCLGKIFHAELPWLGGKKKIFSALADIWKLRRILRLENYSAAVDVKGDPIIILLLHLSGIPVRAGFSNGGLGFLLTHPFSQPENIKRHEIDLSLLGAFEGWKTDFYRSPRLSISDKAVSLEKPDNYLQKITVAIHLGAGVQARRWPLKRWSVLLSALAGRYDIVIIGSPEDSRSLFSLAPDLAVFCLDLSGQSWAETARIIHGAAVFIGADSGPAHLAAALGCPVISIFSAANNPAVWAPAGAEILIFDPGCAGCEKDYCSGQSCLEAIAPQAVIDRLNEILKL